MSGSSILPFKGTMPRIADDVFLAEGARVIGDVEIGGGSSVWFNTVIRGDVHSIRIGRNSNIQDNSVVHVTGGLFSTVIGDEVLVGHMALVHGAVLEDRCMIGMRAMIMDDCVVETGALLAAGSLLPPGKRVPAGQLWSGSPAKYVRDLTDKDREMMARSLGHYVDLARTYRE